MATRAYAYTAGSATTVTDFTVNGDLLYENAPGDNTRDLSIGNGPEGYDYRMGPDEATYNTIAFAGSGIANPLPAGSVPSGTSNLTFFGALRTGDPDLNFTRLADYVGTLSIGSGLPAPFGSAGEAVSAINNVPGFYAHYVAS